MRYLAACRRPDININTFGPFADAGIIRATQRDIHHLEHRVDKPLQCPQRKAENVFQHQRGSDRHIGVT